MTPSPLTLIERLEDCETEQALQMTLRYAVDTGLMKIEEDDRVTLVIDSLSTILSLARKGLWAEQAKETLEDISAGRSMTMDREELKQMAKQALQSFPKS